MSTGTDCHGGQTLHSTQKELGKKRMVMGKIFYASVRELHQQSNKKK